MSKNTIFHYARKAAQAEEKIIELLDRSLRDDPADAPVDVDLQKSARPRPGSESSG